MRGCLGTVISRFDLMVCSVGEGASSCGCAPLLGHDKIKVGDNGNLCGFSLWGPGLMEGWVSWIVFASILLSTKHGFWCKVDCLFFPFLEYLCSHIRWSDVDGDVMESFVVEHIREDVSHTSEIQDG